MVGELLLYKYLPKEKILVVRPSIIMGDSRGILPRSFVIMWAFAVANKLRLIPVNPNKKIDIIPVDFAVKAIISLLMSKRNYNIYHISAGEQRSYPIANILNTIEKNISELPAFKFVDIENIKIIKLWARNYHINGELNSCKDYFEYWEKIFENRSDLRILLAGFEPYLRFAESGQVFDNSRLINDTNIELPMAAHEYIESMLEYFPMIDILEGAVDP